METILLILKVKPQSEELILEWTLSFVFTLITASHHLIGLLNPLMRTAIYIMVLRINIRTQIPKLVHILTCIQLYLHQTSKS